jgi:N-acetylneuraminic acid mutarotase
MGMSKSLAFVIVLVFLTTSSVIAAKPVSGGSTAGDSWVEKAPMNVARANLGVAVVNGDIYAIGGNTIAGEYNLDQGFSSGTTGGVTNTVERYDPVKDTWTLETPMPTKRDSFAIAVYKDSVYCIGGRISIPYVHGVTDNAIIGINQVYNTTNDTWQTKKPLPTVEWPLQACVVNGNIYVIGGIG